MHATLSGSVICAKYEDTRRQFSLVSCNAAHDKRRKPHRNLAQSARIVSAGMQLPPNEL